MISTAARDFYQVYLNSPDWRRRRNQKLKAVGWQCERCSARRFLNVHHKTYDRLGAEWMEDLEVLCANCHEAHHLQETEQSSLGIYLKLAREALRQQPFASISDLADLTKTACARNRIAHGHHQVDRALRLVTGTRIIRPEPARLRDLERLPDPTIVSAQEAHEILTRLNATVAVRSMPTIERPLAEQLAHEARVRQQATEFLRQPIRRKPRVRERLEAIFAGAA